MASSNERAPALTSRVDRTPLADEHPGRLVRRWVLEALPPNLREALRTWRAGRRDARDWKTWRRTPVVPPPHVVKMRTVLDHARRFGLHVLIETGTFEGEMARKCRHGFRRIVTIEIDPDLARRAARRLARYPTIEVIEGDSAHVLPRVLSGLGEPAVFWLDGHFSGTGTGRGERDTPLVQELEAIGRHPVPGHVVLVDDARMLGSGDYPTLEEIRQRLAPLPPGGEIVVADDIVRWTPRAAQAIG